MADESKTTLTSSVMSKSLNMLVLLVNSVIVQTVTQRCLLLSCLAGVTVLMGSTGAALDS